MALLSHGRSFMGPVGQMMLRAGAWAAPGTIAGSTTLIPSIAIACNRGIATSHASMRGSDAYGDLYAPITPPRNFGLQIVPEMAAFIVERFGKFHRLLPAGLHFLIPAVDRIAYVQSLKEMVIPIQSQTAITRDNVSVTFDGVLYVKVIDAVRASYGVDNVLYAVGQLAQTTMRSELGKITLDKTFVEREVLNQNIVRSINEAGEAWGLQCLRYEIKDITPPRNLLAAMELQAEAERRKRANILESEGQRQAKINVAEADKQQVILASEASREEAINIATGEAEAIQVTAQATARGLSAVSMALSARGGADAAALRVAEKYLDAFRQLAQQSTTLLLPSSVSDPASIVAQATSIYRTIAAQQQHAGGAGPAPQQSDASPSGADTTSGGSSGSSSGGATSSSGSSAEGGTAPRRGFASAAGLVGGGGDRRQSGSEIEGLLDPAAMKELFSLHRR